MPAGVELFTRPWFLLSELASALTKSLRASARGGMGEVYKANDTRLNRIVAIKTSKTEFSERFEREAKGMVALDHPDAY
ncbi:MAG: hypothetical protein LAO55_09290 [Acidobacteriia bacterium]|nr:hypothetical protein [Terriglobia bacterium]